MKTGARTLLAASIIVFGLLSAAPARADSFPSFATEVTISHDGAAHFVETIDYTLGANRHGIYRDVPIVGNIGGSQYLYYDFTMGEVTRNDQPENFTQTSNNIYERLKIGNAEKIISGTQRYKVDYTLSPFVRHDPAGDYITINLTGDKWDETIEKSSGVVTLPAGVKVLSATCFTGPTGSTDRNCTVVVADNQITVASQQTFVTGAGMTLDLVVPAGSFAESGYLVPSSTAPVAKDDSDSSPVVIWCMAIAALIFALFGIRYGYSLWQRRSRRKQQTVVPQYEAPDNLLPGEVGLLADDVANSVEITATILHLAVRGHLKITYSEEKSFLRKKQRFRLTPVTTTDPLEDFEKLLYDGIFGSLPLDAIIYIDQLQPTTMAPVAKKMNERLTARLKAKGYYLKKVNWAERTSDEGYQEWAKVQGLKLYLSVAEKDRIKFAEAPDKTPERFTKLLPYAIALGVEGEWAKQFEGIDISPATESWYNGGSFTNAALFTHTLSSSMATAVSSNFTPPSSSSGSGGGFSGGGGGGGGGGGW